MKTVTFPCSCGATLQIGQDRIGLQARCANCGAVLVVPDPSYPDSSVQQSATCRTSNVTAASQGVVKVMKWLEPSIMKRVGNKAFNTWISLGLIFGVGIAGMILRAVSHQGPHPHPYWLVFLGCAGVGFAFDGARRMLSFVPSIAIVSQEGINLNTIIGIGAHLAYWPWHSIGSAQLELGTVGCKSVRILTLYSHDRQQIGTIGIPLSAPMDQIAQAFETMGKPLR